MIRFQDHFLRQCALALHLVDQVVGYDPQRLLPAPSKPNYGVLGTAMTEMFSTFVSNGFVERFFPNDISREFIDFDPVPKLTRYQIEGGHFDMWDREPRRLAPFVSPTGRAEKPKFITPTGRITYPHIKPSEAKSHMAVITGADYASIELQMMAAMEIPSVRCLVLDLDSPGGEMRGNPRIYDRHMDLYRKGYRDHPLMGLEPLHTDMVDTAAGKRDKSYLKHDPSKSHKRRKRK